MRIVYDRHLLKLMESSSVKKVMAWPALPARPVLPVSVCVCVCVCVIHVIPPSSHDTRVVDQARPSLTYLQKGNFSLNF